MEGFAAMFLESWDLTLAVMAAMGAGGYGLHAKTINHVRGTVQESLDQVIADFQAHQLRTADRLARIDERLKHMEEMMRAGVLPPLRPS